MSLHTVDSAARKELAALVRHFGAGLISGGEFESRYPSWREIGLSEIEFAGLWPFWGDCTYRKLVGRHRLPPEGREWLSRIVMFLRSDSPYRWPRRTGFGQLPIMVLSLLTLGWFGRFWFRYRAPDGEESVWPFYTRAEYEEALRTPPYLRGAR